MRISSDRDDQRIFGFDILDFGFFVGRKIFGQYFLDS